MAYAAGLRGILPVHNAICQPSISIETQFYLTEQCMRTSNCAVRRGG